MGAAKGNKNGRGKKGRSGRKSYAQEKANYEELRELWETEFSKEEVSELLEKTRSVKNIFLSQALTGRERVILKIFDKLFPDKIDLTSRGRKIGNDLPDKELTAIKKAYAKLGENRISRESDAGSEAVAS